MAALPTFVRNALLTLFDTADAQPGDYPKTEQGRFSGLWRGQTRTLKIRVVLTSVNEVVVTISARG